MRRRVGLFVGPALFLAMVLLPTPAGLDPPGWHCAAAGIWMAVWWVTEAIPIPATALLPLVLFPLLGVSKVKSAAAPYANPLIFLFMGGFLIALAMQRWNLHRRIALNIIHRLGTRPSTIVLGFMIACAFLSMWVSNTATTMMMLPIGLSILELARSGRAPSFSNDLARARAGGRTATGPSSASSTGPTAGAGSGPATRPTAGGSTNTDSAGEPTAGATTAGAAPVDPNFDRALMLGIAYAATVGGLGTLIGTPPNALLAGFMQESYGFEIGFAQWMVVGVPLVVISLPLVFFILTRLVYPIRLNRLPGGRELILQEMRELGPMRGPETTVATVFVLVAALWISRPLVSRVVPGLSDAGIAISGALLLFVLPVNLRRGIFVLNWEWARRLPWDVLILFGGGLSLAAAANDTGLAAWIGRSTSSIGHWPVLFIIAAVTLVIVLLTELTSNTATAATFLPIVASVASGLGRNPLLLVVPAALGASCAFMLPVATPPNAIIYGSGRVSVPQMVRAGVWLNLLFLVLITLFAYLLVPTLFTPPGPPLSP